MYLHHYIHRNNHNNLHSDQSLLFGPLGYWPMSLLIQNVQPTAAFQTVYLSLLRKNHRFLCLQLILTLLMRNCYTVKYLNYCYDRSYPDTLPSRTSWSGINDIKDMSMSSPSSLVTFLEIQVGPPFQDILVGCE